MSYSFKINFTEINKKDLLDFCREIATTSLKNSEEIIWNNRENIPSVEEYAVIYTPFFRKADLNWLYKLFTINFIYWPEKELLGIVGPIPIDTIKKTSSIHFQSSFQRDYSYDIWKGIKCFEMIVDEIKNMDSEEVHTRLNASDHEWYTKEEVDGNLEYYRKILVYDTIYNNLQLSKWMYNERGNFQTFSFQSITCSEEADILKKQVIDIRALYL